MPTQNGFLAPNIGETVARVRAKFPEWFALLDRCNKTAMALLCKLEPPVDDNQKLVEATLYGRALQSLQASIILAERGMVADARTMLRTCAETAIFQLKMAADATFADALIENDACSRKKLANAVLNDPAALAQLSKEVVDSLKRAVAEVAAAYPAGGPKAINVEAVAASANGMAIYTTIFRLTSNDAAHASLKSLERHFTPRKSGGYQLHFGPQPKEVGDTLSSAVNLFLFVLVTAGSSFNVSEFEKDVTELHEEFKRMLKAEGEAA